MFYFKPKLLLRFIKKKIGFFVEITFDDSKINI